MKITKIMTVVIIGMFLLTSVTAISAVGLKANISESASHVKTVDVSESLNTETGTIVVVVIQLLFHGFIIIEDATVTAIAKDDGENYDIPFNSGINSYKREGIPVGDYEVTVKYGSWTPKKDTTITEGETSTLGFVKPIIKTKASTALPRDRCILDIYCLCHCNVTWFDILCSHYANA